MTQSDTEFLPLGCCQAWKGVTLARHRVLYTQVFKHRVEMGLGSGVHGRGNPSHGSVCWLLSMKRACQAALIEVIGPGSGQALAEGS